MPCMTCLRPVVPRPVWPSFSPVPRPVGPEECSHGRKAVGRGRREERSPVVAQDTFVYYAPTGLSLPATLYPRPCGRGYILPALRAWRQGFAAGIGLLALLLTGCVQQMADQPRYDTYDKSTFFADTLSARPLPEGVIPRADPANLEQPPITMDLLTRGQQRYNIYCTPCHGFSGNGDGMAALRGFQRAPASFHSEKLRSADPSHFFDVISNGFGAMSPYAHQLDVHDRWAVVAYIRALQLSQWAPMEDIPADELRKIESEKR
jgi:mono/diheme cytochrome c family protein